MADDEFRDRVRQGLLEQTGKATSSSLRRMGRTALTMFRSGRAIREASKRERKGEDLDEKDLARIARIVSTLGGMKGVAMKMGQIMSYIDVALPEELREGLAVLQTHSQPMPVDQVREILRSQLGPAARTLLDTLEPTPAAAASIGQVHRARIEDGTPVAVKVQYPEAQGAIRGDFGPAAGASKFVSLLYPDARIKAVIGEVKARFLEECDYTLEARRQQRFVELYAGHPTIVVPAVHPRLCTSLVLTTTWVPGRSFEDFLASDPAPGVRDRIGVALFDFYVGSVFRHGLYNCDPHPGNYLFLADDRIALLDYGCTRAFDPGFVVKLAALSRAVRADEREQLHRALVDLRVVRDDKPYDYELVRRLFRSFYGPMLVDEEQAIDLGAGLSIGEVMRGKRKLMKLSLPAEFVFLMRIRFGLLSILARLGARANWYRLEQGYLEELRREQAGP